jgi:hypothetical protein
MFPCAPTKATQIIPPHQNEWSRFDSFEIGRPTAEGFNASLQHAPSPVPHPPPRFESLSLARFVSYYPISTKKKNPRGLCLAGVSSRWPAACVSAYEACASPTPPSGAEERPPCPACGRPPCGTGSCPQGRGNGLRARRAAPPPRPACRAASAHGSITGHRRRRGQGRGSAPTKDWTTCSILGGGRGWPRGKRSSGQRRAHAS